MGEFLKDKATRLVRIANECSTNGDFDFAAFHYEQACQMFIKYVLWKKVGDFTKTHSLFDLLGELETAFPEKRDTIQSFISANRKTISKCEKAYIESRYFSVSFVIEEIKELKDFTESFRTFLQQFEQ